MLRLELFFFIPKANVRFSFSLLFPSLLLRFCPDTAAAECSDIVQVWAVGSGLLSCPPVAAPRRGYGVPHSGTGRSEASQVPPRPSGCPPLWVCPALLPDPLPPSVSCAHCEALCPNCCLLHRTGRPLTWNPRLCGRELGLVKKQRTQLIYCRTSWTQSNENENISQWK